MNLSVDIKGLGDCRNALSQCERVLDRVRSSVSVERSSMSSRVLRQSGADVQLREVIRRLQDDKESIQRMRTALSNIERRYSDMEKKATELSGGANVGYGAVVPNNSDSNDGNWLGGLNIGWFNRYIPNILPNYDPNWIGMLGTLAGLVGGTYVTEGTSTGWSYSYSWNNRVSTEDSEPVAIGNAAFSGTRSADWLTGEASHNGQFDIEVDSDGIENLSFSTGFSASGALGQGTVVGRFWDFIDTQITGQLGSGHVNAEIKFTLYEDGRFSPGFEIVDSDIGVSGVHVEGMGRVGDDQFGKFVEFEGDLLHADAGLATGGLPSVFTISPLGIFAPRKIGAEASVASGKVVFGDTIMGVDTRAGIGGDILGVGADVDFEINDHSVSGDISAILGVGADVEVGIDWEDAQWVNDGIDTVEEIYNNYAYYRGYF